jgi:hypothetical protein
MFACLIGDFTLIVCNVFFWVIPWRLSFYGRRFGTLYRFHLHRQVDLPLKMELIESSETSAIKTQTPGNYPKENITQIEHGESLKSRITLIVFL